MPELPEVETIRRGLLPQLAGRQIVRVLVRETRLRQGVDADALRKATLRRPIRDLQRRGKYLLFHFEGGKRLVVHLGMTGSLILSPGGAERGKHEHIAFSLDNGMELRFSDPRRFGLVEAIDAASLAADRRFASLGVEPLSAECTPGYFYDRSRNRKKPIKNYLMDAGNVVGIGNIYASEALFLAGIRPGRPACRLDLEDWKNLTRSVKRVLRDAIRRGGTTFRDFKNARGGSGYFQVHLRVYDRAGRPCRVCGREVRRKVQAGRSTYYCSQCQK